MAVQRIRVYSSEPAEMFVRYNDDTTGSIVYTPTAPASYLLDPVAGTPIKLVEMSCKEAFPGDGSRFIANRSLFYVYAKEADAFTGGYPVSVDRRPSGNLPSGSVAPPITGEFRDYTVVSGPFMPGDTLTFFKEALIRGIYLADNTSPGYAESMIRYAVNGGVVDENVVASSYDGASATMPVTLTVTVTDWVPTRPGYTFAGWLVETDYSRTVPEGGFIGRVLQPGDTVTTVDIDGSGRRYRVLGVSAQWVEV